MHPAPTISHTPAMEKDRRRGRRKWGGRMAPAKWTHELPWPRVQSFLLWTPQISKERNRAGILPLPKLSLQKPMGCFRRRVTKATADAEGSSSHQDARLGEAQRRCGHDYACSRGGRLTQGLSPLPPPYSGTGMADLDPSHAGRGGNRNLGRWSTRRAVSTPRRNLHIIFLDTDPMPRFPV